MESFWIELSTASSASEFTPSGTSDWEKVTVDLGAYGGLTDVRVALVAINDFGNNLYLDNLEFFATDNTFSEQLDENEIRIYPNPSVGTVQISVNLSQRQDVDFILIDALGRAVRRQKLGNTLNQTYQIELPFASGVYIAHIIGSDFSRTQRIILAR